MNIVTFNINGLRARLHQLEAIVEKHRPDVLCLQEIKVHDNEFPLESVLALGYHCEFHGQKAHYGVATLSREKATQVVKGFPTEAATHQRRLLITTHNLKNGQKLRIINGYFPQGENRDHPEKFPNKRQFYQNLRLWLETEATPEEHLAVVGDMNISPTDADIGIGEENRKRWLRQGKCSFLPEERQWLEDILSWGLTDLFADRASDEQNFSWFDYRSRGFESEPKRGLRIDLILATESMRRICTGTGIDYDIRGMDKPSDHCPVWARFDMMQDGG